MILLLLCNQGEVTEYPTSSVAKDKDDRLRDEQAVVAISVAQLGGTLELANLDDSSGGRVQVRFPLVSVEELERHDQALRELFARLMLSLIVLPEEGV